MLTVTEVKLGMRKRKLKNVVLM